jgi:hypothetical protein
MPTGEIATTAIKQWVDEVSQLTKPDAIVY